MGCNIYTILYPMWNLILAVGWVERFHSTHLINLVGYIGFNLNPKNNPVNCFARGGWFPKEKTNLLLVNWLFFKLGVGSASEQSAKA